MVAVISKFCAGLALLQVASSVRKRQARKDCYSVYDHKNLIRISEGRVSAEDLADKLADLGCTNLGENRPDQAICDEAATQELRKFARDQTDVVDSNAGALFRNASGVPIRHVRGASVRVHGVETAFYAEWRDFADRTAQVEAAVAASGGVATYQQIGTSYEGRPIMAVRIIGQGWEPGMPRVVIDHQLHAREWITGMAGVYAVEAAVAKAKADPSWLAGMELVIVPLSNPDGILYSETNDRMWRKNRNTNGGGNNCAGVDLNRNFDPAWGEKESTSDRKCSQVYIGSGPFSEPETQAIKNLIDEAPVSLHLDVHSYGELILTPWSYKIPLHPRRADIDVVGKAMHDAVARAHGHRYTYGGSEKLYPASGVCPDYSTLQGAFGFTFELRPGGGFGGGGFAPPVREILPTAEEFWAGALVGIEWARTGPGKPAPTTAPTTCPSFASGPDANGDCLCSNWLASCFKGGKKGCGKSNRRAFPVSCTSCECKLF